MSDQGRIEGCASSEAALLIIDMINDLAFPSGERLLPKAQQAADVTLRLRDEADRLGIPTIYVNDNYGQWHSERSRIVESCARPDSPGRDLVLKMAPRSEDYFVIKPQMSGFYSTNLPVLLPKLGVRRVILAGLAADICILFTAADAHMRDYDIWVPADAVASDHDEHKGWALELIHKAMGAEIRSTAELTLEDWANRAGPAEPET